MYKLNEETIQRLSDNAFIPQDEGNRDYQQFLQDVKIHTISIVEGADVIAPDYVALRTGADGYASTGDQLGMIAAGGTTHADHVAAVKTEFPKSNTGGTTIAAIPSWVQTEADALLFREQLAAYKTAVIRLAKYVLSVGQAEVTEMQDSLVVAVDADGMPILDSDGITTYVQESVIITAFIEALDATVEVTTYSDDIEATPTVSTVTNPLIVTDVAERADAQTVVDNTPQPVKDTA